MKNRSHESSNRSIIKSFFLLLLLSSAIAIQAQEQTAVAGAKLVKVAEGWAKNSVNTVVFRKDPMATFKNTQYIAFYNQKGKVVLGKRKLGSTAWELKVSQYAGKVNDAHMSISLMVDGEGYVHISWNHHNNKLHYAKSVSPGSLVLTNELSMTGNKEDRVTYPQFFKLPNGNLIFLYRDGSSGNGNLLMNAYETKSQRWTQIQSNLIDGESNRNAYWQMHIDTKGVFHLSWVWRENNTTASVSANHDICYAKSTDQGLTWQKTTGERYQLPINQASAEYAVKIPQNSELINQTSMTVDHDGFPYIATYWRSADSKIPQYKLVYFDGKKWDVQQVSDRKTPFTLSGGGTKRIPISRPQMMTYRHKGVAKALLIFRDEEHGDKVTAGICDDLAKGVWRTVNLTSLSVGQWEPTFDEELWKQKNLLHLFVQKVEQSDGEGVTNVGPAMVYVLEWDPKKVK